MEKKLTIYYTSDIHGCFSPIDYATGLPADSGLANCMAQFRKDGSRRKNVPQKRQRLQKLSR